MADVPGPPPDLSQQSVGLPDTRVLAGAADAGDAAEALAALQGSAAHAIPPAPLLEHAGAAASIVHAQAPGAPPHPNPSGPGQRIPGMGRGTSLYRGVSKAGDKKKWRAMIQYNHEQHHVGYYPTAEEAARAYDRKALLFMGPSAITNFPPTDYAGEDLTAEGTAEEQAKKRRRTSSFRGVTRAGGKWKAAIRANNVKKDLGVFEDELDAARAYDAAAVQLLGPAAVTNFNKDDVMAAALPLAAAEQVVAASAPAPNQAPEIAQLPSSGAQASGANVQSLQATIAPTAQGSPLWPQLTLPAVNGALQPPILATPLLRFHGVRPTSNGKWHAQVVVEVGRFDTEEEAARAYDRAAVWCLGLTAQTNFPIDEVIQPGPLGDKAAPLHATSQGQPDQAQPDQGQADQGVPSDSDDEDRAREAGPSDVAMPDQATGDLAAGGPPANFGQEPLGYSGGQYTAAVEQAGQPASGQATGQEPGTSGPAPSSTPGQPASNSRHKASRFVGLSKKFNRWKALIKICGRRKELGSYPEEEEAARCYDRHSVLAWGARAKTNFNPLELLAEMPRDALTVLDAVLAGRRERAESGRSRGSGGAISEAVASALSSHPAGGDSSTKAGQEAHAAIASAMAGHSYKKSAHRGVSANWSRWRAQIYVGGRRHELGSFATEGEAARAYDLAAIKLYGADKAKTNFPVEDYRSALEAGAPGSASLGSAAHGVTAGAVPEAMAPTIIDGQVLPAELQALVMAQLRAAGHIAGQPDHEALLSHMLAQAAQAVPPQAIQQQQQQQQLFPSSGPPAST